MESLSAVAAQFFERLQDHYLWLLGLLLMVEPLLDYLFDDYRKWADRFISRRVRTRFAWSISAMAAFAACFLAFRDQYDATEHAQRQMQIVTGERDEARHLLAEERERRSRIEPSPARQKSRLYWQPLTTGEVLNLRAAIRDADLSKLGRPDNVVKIGPITLHRAQIGFVCQDEYCTDLSGSLMSAIHGMGITVETAEILGNPGPGIVIRPDNQTTRSIATAIEKATNGRLLVNVTPWKSDNLTMVLIGKKPE